MWPTDDGWPYPDPTTEVVDLNAEADDDLLALSAAANRLLDGLSPLEREVVTSRFGIAGHPQRSMRELVVQTGLPRGEVREVLGSGLSKLRGRLRS